MDIIKKNDTSLQGILQPFNPRQRYYFLCRILGMGEGRAIKQAQRSQKTLEYAWHKNNDFISMEEYLLANRRKLAKEAQELWFSQMEEKAQQALDNLVDMASEWELLKQGDKQYVWKAIELIAKKQAISTIVPETWEEKVMIRHRKMKSEH